LFLSGVYGGAGKEGQGGKLFRDGEFGTDCEGV